MILPTKNASYLLFCALWWRRIACRARRASTLPRRASTLMRDARCPASLSTTWSSLQAFGLNDSARWACTEDGGFDTLDTPPRRVRGITRTAALHPTADSCRRQQWNALSGSSASRGPAILGLDRDIMNVLSRWPNKSFTRLALPWALERASRRHWKSPAGSDLPEAFTSCTNAMFVACASRGWLPAQGGQRFYLASLGSDLLHRCKADCAQPAAGLCWNECYFVLVEWCMLGHICANGAEAWSQRGDWECRSKGEAPSISSTSRLSGKAGSSRETDQLSPGEEHSRTCLHGKGARSRAVPMFCFELSPDECHQHWIELPSIRGRFACSVANGHCIRGAVCEEMGQVDPPATRAATFRYLPAPRWSCPARGEASHDAVCNVSAAEQDMQRAWLGRVERSPAPSEVVAYLSSVWQVKALPPDAVHAGAILFFWHNAPFAAQRSVRWVCAVCEDQLPLGSIWAPHEEAKLNPSLLAPGACRSRSGQDLTECRLGHLHARYNASRIEFPGFFVHRFAREAATFQASLYVRGVPDHHFVEVMRVSRVENKIGSTLSASNGRSSCTRGQLWFWLAIGSGIWLDVGRSLRVLNIKESLDGCHAARAAGYDTIQLMQSMRGLTFEIVECRAMGLRGDTDVWEDACPPRHVKLRSGLPEPRYSPGLTLPSGQLESFQCNCDNAVDHLNCDGEGEAGG